MSNGTVATKISITDGMSAPLKSMYTGVSELVQAMYTAKDAGKNIFDSASFDSAGAHMMSAVAQLKAYEDQINRVKKASAVWENFGFEQFDTGGFVRAEQEANAANAAYRRLSERQQQISSAARAMELMPANAASDINLVDNKVAALKAKMSLLGIEQSKIGRFNTSGADLFSSKTEDIRRKMARIETVQQQINRAVNDNNIQGVNAGYRELNSLVDSVDGSIKSNTSAQMGFNHAVSTGANTARSMMNYLNRAAGFAAAVFGGKKITESVDTYTDSNARLALLTDNEAELQSLKNSIYQSAKDNRGVYGDSVSNVAKLGLLAGDAFKNNSEIVMFDNLMSKVFKVSGASSEERTSGMYQLTQAMAAGKLQGDEFRSIMENAPLLAQAIADYTGKSKGELKEMSAEGEITADIIKNSLFGMSDDLKKQFDTIPYSFSDTMNGLQNDVQYKTMGIKQHINDMLNGDIGQGITSDIGSGIDWLIDRGDELLWWFERTSIVAGPTIDGIKQDFTSLANAMAGPNGEIQDFLTSIQRIAASDGTRKTLQRLGGSALIVASGFNSAVGLISRLNQRFSGFLPTLTSALIAYKSFQLIHGTLVTPINNVLGLIDSSVQRYNNLTAAINSTTQATTLMNSALTATKWLTYAGGIATVVSGLASVVMGIMTAREAQKLADESATGYSADQLRRARESGLSASTISQIDSAKNDYNSQIKAEKIKLANILANSEYLDLKDTKKIMGASWTPEKERELQQALPEYNKIIREYNQRVADLKKQRDDTYSDLYRQDQEEKKSRSDLLGLDTGWADYKPESYTSVNPEDGDDVQKVEVVNTVDIASEDLRHMREMAEQEAINQFTSKLVQPQINVTFGEVRETADIDAIVKKITSDTIDELNSEADFIHY